MPPVQRRPARPWRAVGAPPLATLVTVLSGVLTVIALSTPADLERLDPRALLRLPLELIVFLAVVLAVPADGSGRSWPSPAGCSWPLSTVFKVLDLGFREVLNRPFDVLIDWRYAGSLVETTRDSVEGRTGTLLLVAAALALVAVLVLVPLALLRLTRVVVAAPRCGRPDGRRAGGDLAGPRRVAGARRRGAARLAWHRCRTSTGR